METQPLVRRSTRTEKIVLLSLWIAAIAAYQFITRFWNGQEVPAPVAALGFILTGFAVLITPPLLLAIFGGKPISEA